MGQQQLLLIALSVIIVGAAVAVGVNMFQQQSTQANRDLITNQAPYIASNAAKAYSTPESMGGLGYDFSTVQEGQDIGISDTLGQIAITGYNTSSDSLTINLEVMGTNINGSFTVGEDGEPHWDTQP